MSLIRKIVLALVGIALAVLMTVLLINPESIVTLALNMTDTSALIWVPLAILFDALVLAVLFVFIRGDRSAHPANAGLMVKAQGAIADVNIDSARQRILRAVRVVPDVLSAEADVKAVHGKADVDLDVVVSRECTSLPDKQREIDRALRQVINKELGLQMAGKPRVHIRMDGEKAALPPADTPSPAPVVAVEPESAAEPPEPAAPEPPPITDAMTVRGESDTESEASEPTS